ncbi:MAG: serine/threonine-protein kinase, partial [Holophagales bacterium]|nr:serine/threonine-protein kinase [Holophagales bacterium]
MSVESNQVSPERWRRIADVVEAILGLEPMYRHPYLAALERQDDDLRREVEHLLERYDGTAPRIRRHGSSHRAGRPDDDRIGPYRTVEWLGAGGMGSVFLAERADAEVDRRVAIKLLRGGSEVPAVLRRFRAERQILAGFEHPNIARMYDAGTTADGRPYMVMEYVDGVPIDRYCRQQGLGVHERLRLFRKVCAAVSYAHRKLVIHRDLKPSNVLVDASGEPKLLDFGIAKILQPESFPLTLDETVAGQGPLTPNYASPEQLRGEPVSTVSDVYSLGVLLYQLLTDELPVRLDKLMAAAKLGDLDIVLEEHRPTRPSVRIAASATKKDPPTEGSLAPDRASLRERRQRAKVLAGDLDNITMEALRPEPEDRYPSVDALDDDLHRYLTGLAVQATGDAWAYRFGKWARRHRLPVALVVLAFLLTSGFALFMTRQATMLALERDRVTSEKVRAEKVKTLFLEFLEMAEAQGEDLRASELLELVRTRLANELEPYPETQEELLLAVGRAYSNLGHHTAAQELLFETVLRMEERYGEVHLEVASARVALASAYARAANGSGIRAQCERALELFERLGKPEHRGAATCWLELVFYHLYLGEMEALRTAVDQASAITERLPEDDPIRLDTLQARAVVATRFGRIAEARQLYETAIADAPPILGPESLELALLFHNHGAMLYLLGDDAATVDAMKRSLEISSQYLSDRHTTVGSALKYLAMARSQLGMLDAAEVDFRRLLDATEATLAVERRDFRAFYRRGVVLAQLGILELRRGRAEEARAFFRATREHHHLLDLERISMSMLTLEVLALLGLGELDAARPHIERLYEVNHLDRDLWQMVRESGIGLPIPAAMQTFEAAASEGAASKDTASKDTASEDTASEDTASEDTASEDTASE